MHRLVGTALTVVLLVSFSTAEAAPFPVVVPEGLHPGDHYQLVFVTASTRNALSPAIADYNTFVNQDADNFHIGPTDFSLSGTPIQWHAIVSVIGANAKENAAQTAPAYNLGGELVANGELTSFLYQPPLISPVKWSPDGSQTARLVFTGTNFTGISSTFPAGTGAGVTSGNSGDTGESWITLGFGSAGTEPATNLMSIYALSDPLTVPVPEPSTLALASLAVGAVGLTACCAKRNRY